MKPIRSIINQIEKYRLQPSAYCSIELFKVWTKCNVLWRHWL